MTPRQVQQNRPYIRDLHLAFPAGQTAGTRLVLTQSTYQLQRWLDWLDANPETQVIADIDRNALHRDMPEALAGRGPWARIAIVDVDDPRQLPTPNPPTPKVNLSALPEAFRQDDPEVRLAACQRALAAAPDDPALLLAAASTMMELQRLQESLELLERAVGLAADWEAVHFELGKLWLRAEETEKAAAAFTEAGRLMPTFAVAFGNLGAALGELDRPDEALAALQHALEHDPRSHPILNNVGAVLRELGRLDEAEQTFRRVIEMAPAFVFGAYNLAHTVFLQGRFGAARHAYEDAYARDPQKNARQACRLAVARTADGDADGAIALLTEVAAGVPDEMMRGMMEEAESTLDALSAVPGVSSADVLRVREFVRGL